MVLFLRLLEISAISSLLLIMKYMLSEWYQCLYLE